MNKLTERMKNQLDFVKRSLECDFRIGDEWYKDKMEFLEKNCASGFDKLRLEAKKHAFLAEAYKKHGLLEPITPAEQAAQDELKAEWAQGKCPLWRSAAGNSYCALTTETGFECPYRTKDSIISLFFFHPEHRGQELHFPCAFMEKWEMPHEGET